MCPAGKSSRSTLEFPLSPHFVDWHRTFAAQDPAASVVFELWFDRGSAKPLVETVRIPRQPSSIEETITALYLSGLINNVLCIHGARSVSIVSEEMKLPQRILTAIEVNILVLVDEFSNMSLRFLHSLVRQVYQTDFSIDADEGHARYLKALHASWNAVRIGREVRQPRGVALALNIGQRMTNHGLVAIDAHGRYTLEQTGSVRTTEAGLHGRFLSAFDALLARIRENLGDQVASVRAVGVSLAATVMSGEVLPVREFGLFATATAEECAEINSRIRGICRTHFPQAPVEIRNDGETQALFAFQYTRGGCVTRQAGPGRHLLSLRLGACPCVHCLDECGEGAAGIQEFGWLATALNSNPFGSPLFVTIHRYLSYRGIAMIAQELGVLKKYRVRVPQELDRFLETMCRHDGIAWEDMQRIARSLGGHIALLAAAVHRHQPLAAVMLLGSRTGIVDEAIFPDIRQGYGEGILGHALALDGVDLLFTAEASPISSLVGAAHASLSAVTSPEECPIGRPGPGPGR